jgi:hypothetical protein
MRMYFIHIFSVLFVFMLSIGAFAQSAADPLTYPDGKEIKGPPFLFFWQDARTDKERRTSLTAKVSIKEQNGETVLFSVKPEYAFGYFYFSSDRSLEKGKYEYTIEMFDKGNPMKTSFFGYKKYPLTGTFEYNGEKDEDTRDPLEFMRLYSARHYNKIENGYNILFYSGSSILCGITAYLLLVVFDFNIITRIIGYIAAVSAVTGVGATGYYTYKYVTFDEKKWGEKEGSLKNTPIMLSCSQSF